MDTRRQQQVAKLLQEEMAALFLKHGVDWYGKAFVTMTESTITPDLEEARFYMSIYNVDNKQETVDRLNGHATDIRFQLGRRIRHQLRKVPHVEFFLDDGMERAERVDALLREP